MYIKLLIKVTAVSFFLFEYGNAASANMIELKNAQYAERVTVVATVKGNIYVFNDERKGIAALTLSEIDDFGGRISASASGYATPLPTVQSGVSVEKGIKSPVLSPTASALVSYEMRINGPKTQLIGADITTKVKLSGINARASESINGFGVNISTRYDTTKMVPAYEKSFEDSISFMSNTVYSFNLFSNAILGSGEYKASSFIDPLIVINPFFASDYTLEFSPGIGNSMSTVPLPSSAPLFGAAILGLAGLGCATKRMKAAAA